MTFHHGGSGSSVVDMMDAQGSVYDQIGGATAMKATVAVFYDRVIADPDLARWFDGIDLSRLKAHQRAFLAAALGGPPLFSGRSITEAHAGLAITDDAYDAIVEHLAVALHDLGVADAVVATVRERIEAMRPEVVAG